MSKIILLKKDQRMCDECCEPCIPMSSPTDGSRCYVSFVRHPVSHVRMKRLSILQTAAKVI